MNRRPPARYAFLTALLAALSVPFLLSAQDPAPAGQYQSPPENLPREVPPQPVAFSHKLHASKGLKCLDCHKTAEKKFTAGLPQPDDCMVCHRTIATGDPDIMKLTQLAAAGVNVYWVPVYDSPSFVFFSHKKHLKAGETCETCHGDVTKYDVLAQELSISMTTCMNCHEKRGVENACFWCHELGQ